LIEEEIKLARQKELAAIEEVRKQYEQKKLEDEAINRAKAHSIKMVHKTEDQLATSSLILPADIPVYASEIQKKYEKMDVKAEDHIRLKRDDEPQLTTILKKVVHTTDTLCIKFKQMRDKVGMMKKRVKMMGIPLLNDDEIPLGADDPVNLTKQELLDSIKVYENMFIEVLDYMLQVVDIVDKNGEAKKVEWVNNPDMPSQLRPAIPSLQFQVERNVATKKRKTASTRLAKDCCRCAEGCAGMKCQRCFAAGLACSSSCGCGGPDYKNCDNPNNYGMGEESMISND